MLVDYRKWPDLPHWRHEMELLGEDEHGVWLGAVPGGLVAKGEEPPIELEHAFVQLFRPGAWWTAIFNSGGTFRIYVDVVTPPRWSERRVTMVDLDLDVALRADGTVELLDEDEFAENAHRYPEVVVDRARTTAARLVLALERGEEPFTGSAASWLARL